MPERDPLIMSYSHLKQLSREKEALHTLKKIASLVKPIMRARGWRVGELAEFFPDEDNLLGLNVDRGRRICLRLRYAGDKTQFLPFEQVTDTMLHELSHNVHGPHDAKFHALWDQLRDEHEALIRKGYTGEGFLSEGHRLGGRGGVPMDEARRLARAAAERRNALNKGSGQRLGGTPLHRGVDARGVIAEAAERRNKSLQGCGNSSRDADEIRQIGEAGTRNGFRTQAEEDAANEAAIAQALWELVQEDEKARHGSSYISPSAAHPAGSLDQTTPSHIKPSGSRAANSPSASSYERATVPRQAKRDKPIDEAASAQAVPSTGMWSCKACTLENTPEFLCCDACGGEREENVTQSRGAGNEVASKRPRISGNSSTAADLNHSRMVSFRNSRTGASDTPVAEPTGPAYWICSFCDNTMERQWWTCNMCGRMKDSS